MRDARRAEPSTLQPYYGFMVDAFDGPSLRLAQRHSLLSHPVRRAIIGALLEVPRDVTELAEAAEVHPSTVRFHLHRLEQAGLIDSETRHRGTRGRPTKQYHLRELPEAQDPNVQLLMKAIVSLTRRTRDRSAASVATEEGFRLGQELGRQFVSADAPNRRWMVELLEHLSFSPQPRERDGCLEVDLLHCPFWGGPAEEDGDVVCSFHHGLLQGAANTAGHDPADVDLAPFIQPRRCRATLTTSEA